MHACVGTRSRLRQLVAGVVLAMLAPLLSIDAQYAVSTAAVVPLTAFKSSGLTLAVTSGATQSLASIADGAANSFATPVRITTSWELHPAVGELSVVAWFSSAAAALSSGTASIPSAWMKGRVVTGSPVAFTAFTQNGVQGTGTAGASLLLFSFPILGNNRNGTRSDDLELQLDLTGQPALTPGTYSGVLNIQIVAQ
ncbi:MAG TPA: hypothetical protein VFG84_03570 [Gemmatimonadaceae bacterium]|nr:hypothetical protein [Gemmatimonadaceae bacterium]